MKKQMRKDPLVWGIILIFFGLVFVLQNLDVNIWGILARLWPVILILWGGWKLYFGIKERQEEIEAKQD